VSESRTAPGGAHYLLGHTESELERLDIQGVLYRDITVRALTEAGVAVGMRVLDLGCGTGDVTLTAAELVGPAGSVLGIDRSPNGVEVARRHAGERGMDGRVDFLVGEIDELLEGRFDAIVGRFVLMHQSDPAATLRAAARALRPGGVVVMIESHMAILQKGEHSWPHSALYDRIVKWKSQVVAGAGADIGAGLRLRRTFLDAGLPEPRTRLEARIEGGPDSPYYHYIAESVRSMLPEAARLGLGGFTSDDADTLADRLRTDVVEAGGVLVVWPVVVAWSRKGVG
jgi:SAM-dependent methyltransferase